MKSHENQFIKLIMRIRKNQKNRMDLLMVFHPFQQSLMIIINTNNQKAFDQIMKNELRKADQYVTIVEKNMKVANHNSVCFCKLKAMHFNNKALLKMKENKNNQALQAIEQTINFQKKFKLHPIQQARSLLNKAVIFSKIRGQQIQNENKQAEKNFFTQQQSLRIVKQALQLLRTKKHLMNELNQIPKYNEYILLNFCSVAKQLAYLKDNQQAIQLYKQGYQLAVKNLGHMHYLTQLLRKQAKIMIKNRANTQTPDFSLQTQQKGYSDTKKSVVSQSKVMSQSIELQIQKIINKSNKKNFRRLKHKNQLSSLSPYQKYQIHSKRLQTENISSSKTLEEQPEQMRQLEKIKKLYQIRRGQRKIITEQSSSLPQKQPTPKVSKKISSKNIISDDTFFNSKVQKKNLIEKFSSMNNKQTQKKVNKSETIEQKYIANKHCQLI